MRRDFCFVQGRYDKRFYHCCLSLLLPGLLLGLFYSLPVKAEDNPPLSDSVVLVLKLVSKTLVEPVTGIVISDDGLVLIPAYLVKKPGEIVVLDDGVDIAVNSRPGVIVDIPGAGGLVLIKVEGLNRPAITLSTNALDVDQALHLETFPPAKLMAEGAKPLWVPVRMAKEDAISRVTVSEETPLPFITGPIIDGCGYLAGLSLALGVQSLDLDKYPVVVFTDELSQVFDTMQLEMNKANCEITQPPEVPEINGEKASAQLAAATDMQGNEGDLPKLMQESEETGDNTVNESILAQGLEQAKQNASQATPIDNKPSTHSQLSLWRQLPAWLFLVGIIGLATIIWKGLLLHRLSKDTDPTSAQPRSIPLNETEFPDLAALPAGCDAVIMIQGWIGTDNMFTSYCAVKSGEIDIVIGSAQADINIEHPTISPRHARLVSDNALMTISDLGSDNGTFINNTTCLPGEIMYAGSGDEIFLGCIGFHFTVIKNQADRT